MAIRNLRELQRPKMPYSTLPALMYCSMLWTEPLYHHKIHILKPNPTMIVFGGWAFRM